MKEYRIVRNYHGFFSHYCYKLQQKRCWRFLFWTGIVWDDIAGNSLTTEIPESWLDFNIVDKINSDYIL